MDTSAEYIKMCEGAFRDLGIVGACHFSDGTGIPNIWAFSDCLKIFSTIIQETTPRPPWFQVYRLDQLIEMADTPSKLHLRVFDHMMLNLAFGNTASPEQMWIAYIMAVKYNKRWTGEEWRTARVLHDNEQEGGGPQNG